PRYWIFDSFLTLLIGLLAASIFTGLARSHLYPRLYGTLGRVRGHSMRCKARQDPRRLHEGGPARGRALSEKAHSQREGIVRPRDNAPAESSRYPVKPARSPGLHYPKLARCPGTGQCAAGSI